MVTVEQFMTPRVSTIGIDATLADAKVQMRREDVRHLPVLHGGEVRGILSEREVDLVTAIAERSPDELSVKLAMHFDILQVERGELLREVARKMADTKCGSAIVMDGETVVGIFTTVDALRVLAKNDLDPGT